LLIPLACHLLKMGKSILICANSNSQIDELLMSLRFEQNIDAKHLLRIGSRKAVPEKLHELLVENRLAVELQNCTLEEDKTAKAYMERAQTLVEQKVGFFISKFLIMNYFFAVIVGGKHCALRLKPFLFCCSTTTLWFLPLVCRYRVVIGAIALCPIATCRSLCALCYQLPTKSWSKN